MSHKRSANMKAVTLLLAVLVFFVALDSQGARKKAPAQENPVAVTDGQDLVCTVVDKDDKPVKKADVFLYLSAGYDEGLFDRMVAAGGTTRKGTYTFKNAVSWKQAAPRKPEQPMKYAVIARHPKLGFSFMWVKEGDELDKVKVTMDRLREYTVRVVDDKGQPVPDAKVSLSAGSHSKEMAEKVGSGNRYIHFSNPVDLSVAISDSEGKAKLMGFYDPSFRVRKEGFAEGWYNNKPVILFPGAGVSGKVTRADGTPVAGAYVTYEYNGNRLVWNAAGFADDQGNYSFADVPAKGFRYSWMKPEEEEGDQVTCKVKAVDPDPDSAYVAGIKAFQMNPGEKSTQDVMLPKGVAFAGKVIDIASNEPAKNININLYYSSGGQYLDRIPLKTDENGAFHQVLPPGVEINAQWEQAGESGDYLIDEQWQRMNWSPFRGVVNKDKTDLVWQVKLWQVQPLRGKVVDKDGKPVDKGNVLIHSDIPSIDTNENGEFSLKVGPTDREFELYARNSDQSQATVAKFPAGSNNVTLTLEPTRDYEGEVLNTEGLPAANLFFYVDVRINGASLYRVRQEPTTDKDGKFKLTKAYPKTNFSIFWTSDNDQNRDYDYGNAKIDLANAEEGKPIQFTAKQYLNALMGRVVNDKGEPVRDAEIRVVGGGVVRQNASQIKPTNERGEFTIMTLAPGIAELRIAAAGYKTIRTSAATDAIDLVVTLPPASAPSSCRVKLQDAAGQPLPDFPVQLWLMKEDKGRMSVSAKRTVRTNKDGLCRFSEKVAEGQPNYAVAVFDSKGYDYYYRTLQLNEDCDCAITLYRDSERWKGRVLDLQGQPIAGAKVLLREFNDIGIERMYVPADDLGLSLEYKTGENGEFELTRVGKDRPVGVLAQAEGFVSKGFGFYPQPEYQTVTDIRLPRNAFFKCQLVDKTTKQPLKKSHVEIRATNHSMNSFETDDNGTLDAKPIEPGQYTVNVTTLAKGDRHIGKGVADFSVAERETVDLTIEVEEGLAISGKVVDKKTGQVPSGKLRLRITSPDDPYSGYAPEVKPDGTWSIVCAPGSYQISYFFEGERRPQLPPKTFEFERGKTYDNIVIEVGDPEESKAQ